MNQTVKSIINPSTQANSKVRGVMDITEIQAAIPHRYPFLMVDRIVDIVPMQSATGIKQVTVNEPFFTGHFPEHPVMPGVLIIEAMAQTASALIAGSPEIDTTHHVVYMRAVDNTKFRQAVFPGDTLRLAVSLIRRRRELWLFSGIAKVDDNTVAESQFSAVLRDLTT